MIKKTNINKKDEEIYFHQVNNFKKNTMGNKEDMNKRADNNIPLCYMHGGERNICSYTYSKALQHGFTSTKINK